MLNLLERLLLNTMKRNKNTEKNYILITGADSGIGKQFAIQYSNIGYKIILTARNLEKLKAVQAELKTESVIIIKDLSIMDNCYELLKEVEQYKIDMFINNAGFGDFGLIEETNTEKALKMTDLNCKASLILIKEFIKRFNKENIGCSICRSVLPCSIYGRILCDKSLSF